MIKAMPNCDCPESSEALGLKVSHKAWRKDCHKMTPTKVIRKTYCKYCGNYVLWKRVEIEKKRSAS